MDTFKQGNVKANPSARSAPAASALALVEHRLPANSSGFSVLLFLSESAPRLDDFGKRVPSHAAVFPGCAINEVHLVPSPSTLATLAYICAVAHPENTELKTCRARRQRRCCDKLIATSSARYDQSNE